MTLLMTLSVHDKLTSGHYIPQSDEEISPFHNIYWDLRFEMKRNKMNARRITLTVSCVLSLLVMAACAPASGTDANINIGAGDAGKTITLREGDTLTVTLDGNTTTGYIWLMQTMDPAILKQVGEPAYAPESDAIGAPGTISLTFQAVKSGQADLVLNYMRSFEKDMAPLHTFEVTVVVK
jgi:inhibitor of cysteine peptidase